MTFLAQLVDSLAQATHDDTLWLAVLDASLQEDMPAAQLDQLESLLCTKLDQETEAGETSTDSREGQGTPQLQLNPAQIHSKVVEQWVKQLSLNLRLIDLLMRHPAALSSTLVEDAAQRYWQQQKPSKVIPPLRPQPSLKRAWPLYELVWHALHKPSGNAAELTHVLKHLAELGRHHPKFLLLQRALQRLETVLLAAGMRPGLPATSPAIAALRRKHPEMAVNKAELELAQRWLAWDPALRPAAQLTARPSLTPFSTKPSPFPQST